MDNRSLNGGALPLFEWARIKELKISIRGLTPDTDNVNEAAYNLRKLNYPWKTIAYKLGFASISGAVKAASRFGDLNKLRGIYNRV